MAFNLEEMNDEERKEVEQAFSEWVKEKGYKAPEEVEGLVKKKDELLSKVSKLNKEKISEDKREILETLQELGVDSADDIKSAFSENGKSKNSDVERQLKKLQKEAEESKQRAEKLRSEKLSMTKESAIKEALTKAKVKPEAYNVLFDHFDKQSIVEEGEDGKISVYANTDEQPSIDAYVSQWAESDEGKLWVAKPENKGIGAKGSNENSQSSDFKLEDEMNKYDFL